MLTKRQFEQILKEPFLQVWVRENNYAFVEQNESGKWDVEPNFFVEISITHASSIQTDFPGTLPAGILRTGSMVLRIKYPQGSGVGQLADLSDMLVNAYENTNIHDDIEITSVVGTNVGVIDKKFVHDVTILFNWEN